MGMRERIEDAIKRLKKESKLYQQHRARKYDGLPTSVLKEGGAKPPESNVRLKKIQRNIKLRRAMNRRDVYGKRPERYKI